MGDLEDALQELDVNPNDCVTTVADLMNERRIEAVGLLILAVVVLIGLVRSPEFRRVIREMFWLKP